MSTEYGCEQYALVSYVRNALGEFVEDLRREVHPAHAHLPTHVTVLPPRPLQGTEEEAVAVLREMGKLVTPFRVELGEVESFLPTTPTVFIRISFAGYKMRELHDLMNCNGLTYTEKLPYMPHVTVAKLDTNEQAAEALQTSKIRWREYKGSHSIMIERLSFVRGSNHTWTDLADVVLSAPPR